MNQTIELGLDTFGDITDGPDGKPLSAPPDYGALFSNDYLP